MNWMEREPGVRRHRFALACMVTIAGLLLLGPGECRAQDETEDGAPDLGINWLEGPGVGSLGGVATVQVPEGFVFAGRQDTMKLMEVMQNPVSGMEMGFVAPVEGEWFVVFEFDRIGYVKDDEKAELDAEAILESLRDGQSASNKERERRGWPSLEITGWMQPPHYDTTTNNLEWATRLRSSDGGQNVNYNSRLLGRAGVMSATLVGSEADVAGNMDTFRSMLADHEYVAGERYAEYRPGDKIAEYGLTALITGGVVAAALKTGLLKKFWKLIVVAFAGGAAALRKLFGKGPAAPQDDTAAG